jgi:hypothetical protein
VLVRGEIEASQQASARGRLDWLTLRRSHATLGPRRKFTVCVNWPAWSSAVRCSAMFRDTVSRLAAAEIVNNSGDRSKTRMLHPSTSIALDATKSLRIWSKTPQISSKSPVGRTDIAQTHGWSDPTLPAPRPSHALQPYTLQSLQPKQITLPSRLSYNKSR